jgi:phosphate:Na+ symporter
MSEVNWLMLGLNLIGALSVFLFGMSTLSKGLKSALGGKLRELIQLSCSNPALAVVTGMAATGALNSATAVSVLVVEFVQSGDMTFQQSLGVCLGICLGSTLTPYMVAFKLTQYALALAATGRGISSVAPSPTGKHIGEAIFGMGLMFLGMEHMSSSIAPLRTHTPFLAAIVSWWRCAQAPPALPAP